MVMSLYTVKENSCFNLALVTSFASQCLLHCGNLNVHTSAFATVEKGTAEGKCHLKSWILLRTFGGHVNMPLKYPLLGRHSSGIYGFYVHYINMSFECLLNCFPMAIIGKLQVAHSCNNWVRVYSTGIASKSFYMLEVWSISYCEVSLSECTCRTWSSCMHMTIIRM